MLTPKEFANKTGLSYSRVLLMCKSGEIEVANKSKRNGSHFNIFEKELDKYTSKDGYITKTDYENLLKENEKLKTIITQFKMMFTSVEL